MAEVQINLITYDRHLHLRHDLSSISCVMALSRELSAEVDHVPNPKERSDCVNT